MVRMSKGFIALALFISLLACATVPEPPLNRSQLLDTGIYRTFTVQETPEEILTVLNAEGEVTLAAMAGRSPVYVKIKTTVDGLNIRSYAR